MELRHLALEAEAAGVGNVERPVARAVVVIIEGVARRVIHLRVSCLWIARGDKRGIGRRWALAPVLDHHRGRRRAAPGLTAAIELGELAGVYLLRELWHIEDHLRR